MKNTMLKSILLSAIAAFTIMPNFAQACACGCGVFDVGTGTMMPTAAGGTVWLEYNFMNQNKNWSNTSSAPSGNNMDKQIKSNFYSVGGQYMFNRSWGIMAELPYTDRTFKTADDDGNVNKFQHRNFGDVHLQGIYSGFSSDMSTGVTFGLKLPTGDYSYANFDRDTEIGSGSTDLLLGAYHMGKFAAGSQFSWFVNGQYDRAFLTNDNYRPGDEIDVATGVYYDAGSIFGAGKVSPLFQLIGSNRQSDSGINSMSDDTGYNRLLVSPGVEYDINSVKLYGDVEVPVYQNINGNQLVAPVLFKLIVGYSF